MYNNFYNEQQSGGLEDYIFHKSNLNSGPATLIIRELVKFYTKSKLCNTSVLSDLEVKVLLLI